MRRRETCGSYGGGGGVQTLIRDMNPGPKLTEDEMPHNQLWEANWKTFRPRATSSIEFQADPGTGRPVLLPTQSKKNDLRARKWWFHSYFSNRHYRQKADCPLDGKQAVEVVYLKQASKVGPRQAGNSSSSSISTGGNRLLKESGHFSPQSDSWHSTPTVWHMASGQPINDFLRGLFSKYDVGWRGQKCRPCLFAVDVPDAANTMQR